MVRNANRMAIGMTLALMVCSPTVYAQGRLSGILGGGLDMARSAGNRVANRASQGTGLASRVVDRGTGVAQAITQRGTGVARGAALRVRDTGSQVATRGIIVAGSAANSARLAGDVVRDRVVDVGTNVTTSGVIAVGSAVNSARLAENAVQARIDNIVPRQAVAAGVDRFNNATRVIVGGAPAVGQNIVGQNVLTPVGTVAPGLINNVTGVVDGTLQVGGGLTNGNAGQVAGGIVNIVGASQPQLPAEVIPVAAGALGIAGGFIRTGGGGSGVAAPSYAASAPAADSVDTTVDTNPAPVVESTAAQNGSADLVLEDLQFFAQATIVAGPAYVLRFRNQGSASAQGFHVALLAGVNGQVTDDAPRALAYFNSVAAGQVAEVNLRLPVSSTQIRGVDGRSTPMTDVFVALDFVDVVAELDEMNNLAIVPTEALQSDVK